MKNQRFPQQDLEAVAQLLNHIFVGKHVDITHTGNSRLHDGRGVCKAFRVVPDGGGLNMEMTNGNSWGLDPDTITADSVEGSIYPWIEGRRRVQLAPQEEVVVVTLTVRVVRRRLGS